MAASNRIVVFLRFAAFVLALFASAAAVMFVRGELSGSMPSGLGVGTTTVAILCWWFTFRGQHEKDRTVILISFLAGMVLSGLSSLVCLLIEIFGLHYQIPVITILFAAPLGFLVGAICGVCLSRFLVKAIKR